MEADHQITALNIPEEYFLEEEREGFLVSAGMKKCWAAGMKILGEVVEICERHHLRWYAEAGTLLGAVRHKGFIPWDDDIDIAMPREDYMRLWPILRQELPSHYSIHCRYLDPPNGLAWGCVINRKQIDIGEDEAEIAITKDFFGSPYKHAIDIFPLDYVPDDPQEQEIFKVLYKNLHYAIENYDLYEKYGMLPEIAQELESEMGVDLPKDDTLKDALWDFDLAIATMYSEKDACGITNLYFWTCGMDNIRPLSAYERTTELPFEMIKVKAPAEYELVLEKVYGDWRTPKKNTAAHEYPYFGMQEEGLEKIALGRLVEKSEKLHDEHRYDEEKILLESEMDRFSDRYEVLYLYARLMLFYDASVAEEYLKRAVLICDNDDHRISMKQDLENIEKALNKSAD